jgi:putative DNA primase/helicase
VMGDYAAVLPFATLAKDRDIRSVPVEIARLPGRRFVRASEIRGGVALDEGRLKSITGEDTLSARGLYQSPFEFRSVAKLWLAVNKLPRVDDRGHAFWRRAIVLPFRRTFDGSTRDNRLKDKLQAEGAGILNWLIEGALMWQRDGLPRGVEAADRARDDWRESQDLIGQWAHDHVVSDTAAATKAAQAFAAFKTWATTEGLSDREIPGSRTFGEWMGENFKRARRRGGIVYECRVVVQGAGLEAVSGNPHTRAQEGDSPKALHTIHTMHQKSEEDEPDGRF